jgi:gamma-glutamyltranspeptidase
LRSTPGPASSIEPTDNTISCWSNRGQLITGRAVTMAPKGMVTCPHALASQAGVDVLRAGGSVVDAAAATAAALAVIYPHLTGLGGDAFWLIHDAATRTVRYLDGRGRAAASPNTDWFAQRGHAEVPFRGMLPRHADHARRGGQLGRRPCLPRPPPAAGALPAKRGGLCA